jgi:DNA-binding NarL/FixJ family response regulator
LEDVSTLDFVKCRGFEHIVCILVDLDKSILMLTPRQQEVVTFFRDGYSIERISHKLNLSVATIKFHFNAAISKISTYLNSG